MDRTAFEAHFSLEIGEDLKSYIVNQALLHSRYFFVKRMNAATQRGICTHCKSNHVVESDAALKHNQPWVCEKCKSIVQVKSIGRGRGKMFDSMYVIWYEKSLVNSQAITATGYYVSLDYRENMLGELTIDPVSRYLFADGKALMMKPISYYNRDEVWVFTKNAYSLVGKSYVARECEQAVESLKAAVQGTPFVYSQWEHYFSQNIDLVKYFTIFTKYPYVEYLLKMGMNHLVDIMVDGLSMKGSINHRGKTIDAVLGIDKVERRAWKESGIEMTPMLLKTYKYFKDRNVPISWETAGLCGQLIDGSYYKSKMELLYSLNINDKQMIRYALKQSKKGTGYDTRITSILTSWTDYLGECEELGMNLSEDRVLFPNNLHTAHQKTSKKVQLKKDEIVNQKIRMLQPSLNKLRFESSGLIIRPAVNTEELFEEGKKLSHCVGGYAKRYSEGSIAIMVIRHQDDPDKPFYTMEIDLDDKNIRQCRGFKNKAPTKEIESFIEVFKKSKLSKWKKERKVAV